MSRFTMRRGSRRYDSMNRTFGEQGVSIAPRSVFSSSIELPNMTAVGSIEDMDAESYYSRQTTVSETMWNAMRNGAKIGDLIRASPEELIGVLRNHAVKRLGSFTVKDTDILLAFGQQIMLTRGLNTARDQHYQRNWEELIDTRVQKRSKRRQKFLEDNPWEENVTVTAYVVTIADAAAGFENGLLSPLVQKSQIGATSNDIFDLPAVRAVIEYKWHNWARKYLIIEFGLYLGWLISFVVFMIIYIQRDLGESYEDQSYNDRFLEIVAYIMDGLSIVFMSPFLFIEYNTICSYGMRWFQTWNLIDSIAYVLQILVSYYHLFAEDLIETQKYDTLLAVQCVLLFIKVQYFARVFGARTSFMEVLGRVILKARWFFVFIIMTMVSVALSFAVLYKEDHDREKESADDFSDVIRSVVTTYAVLLGNFETDYVFDGSNRAVKGAFFLFFQVVMSITVLNLLIAVMTESYGKVTEESRIMYNIGRAQIMDELEVSLPKSWGPHLEPFCHFIMVEQRPKQNSALSTEPTAAPSSNENESLRADMKALTQKFDDLSSQFNSLSEKLFHAHNKTV